MRYQLTIVMRKGLEIYPLDKDRILVGRSSKCDLKIRDRFASRMHLLVERDNGSYILTDLGTKNQTLLNGELVKPSCSCPLAKGDKIKIGETVLEFNVRNTDSLPARTVSQSNMANHIKDVIPAKAGVHPDTKCRLRGNDPNGAVEMVLLSANSSALAGVITTPLPYLAPQLDGQIIRVFRRWLTSVSFWLVSLLIHLLAFGILIWVTTPEKKPFFAPGAFRVNFITDAPLSDSVLAANSNIDSLIQSVIPNEKIAELDRKLEETEATAWEPEEVAEEKSQGWGDLAGEGLARDDTAKLPPRIGLKIGKLGQGGNKGPSSAGVLLSGNRTIGQGSKILTLKWEHRFLSTLGVRLYQPSGWGHGDQSVAIAPWLISSPGFIPAGESTSIVSGTEEGSGEFSRGQANTNSTGRYVCVTNQGRHKWDYQTFNNAGRASPAILGKEIVGGSTSGWMVHFFRDNGQGLWRFESESRANFIASPAVGELNTTKDGPEIVAVDLNGKLYCLSHRGEKLWSTQISNQPGIATPLIYDVDNDKKLEVVAAGSQAEHMSVLYCFNGATGEVKWRQQIPRQTNQQGWGFNQISSPAIIPHPTNPQITLGIGNRFVAIDGQNGKIRWEARTEHFIYGSPAVGDCDGDGKPEVVGGSLDGKVYCIDSETGKYKWIFETKGQIFSSPALATKGRVASFQMEWSMFRNNAQRSGCDERNTIGVGMDVYIGSNDGWLYLIDGKKGHFLDRFAVKFPELTVANSAQGQLKFISSPIVGDIDGDRKLDVIFTLVDRMVCLTDNRR